MVHLALIALFDVFMSCLRGLGVLPVDEVVGLQNHKTLPCFCCSSAGVRFPDAGMVVSKQSAFLLNLALISASR